MFKIKDTFISVVKKNSILKKNLLIVMDFYHTYNPIVMGFFIRYPSYFKNILQTKLIARPGTLSYQGGAFNPGTILLDENRILLLAKFQILPWYKARGKRREFYLEGNPGVFFLDKESLETRESHILNNLVGFPTDEDFAIEDFRLFQWKDKKMLNHSFVVKGIVEGYVNQKAVVSALSVLDEKEKKVTFCAFPKLDFPTQNFEKNWVYKENGDQLLLFYSFNPYRVLALYDKENFKFKTIINHEFNNILNDLGGFGNRISFSTNPIDFDDEHWLLVIHQINFKVTGRCYYHWGVLIDKATFLPIKITSKPIFSGLGARGRLPGIRYISSIIKTENEILFFAGEGDIYVTVTKKTIKEVKNLFVRI